MRSLITAIALALTTSAACAAGAYISDGRGNSVEARSGADAGSSASITSNSNVSSSNSSSVTSNSSSVGSTATINSNDSTSSCSSEWNGSRCEVACQSPQVAQCVKSARRHRPTCYCQ